MDPKIDISQLLKIIKITYFYKMNVIIFFFFITILYLLKTVRKHFPQNIQLLLSIIIMLKTFKIMDRIISCYTAVRINVWQTSYD